MKVLKKIVTAVIVLTLLSSQLPVIAIDVQSSSMEQETDASISSSVENLNRISSETDESETQTQVSESERVFKESIVKKQKKSLKQ